MIVEYMVKIRMAIDGSSGGNPNGKCWKLQTVSYVAQVGCRLGLACLLVIEYIVYFGHLHNLEEL